jgi:integrase
VEVKGGREAFGYFGASTGRRLRSWLEVRVAAVGVGTVFVSVGGNTPGRPLTTRGLRSALRRLGDRAGVADVSAHAFRRSFACIMTEAGAPGRVVQLAGRWSNLQMVERYTQAMASVAGNVVRPYLAGDWIEP